MAEAAVEAEAVEWAGAMALTLEANGSLIDTVAAIGRKCFSSGAWAIGTGITDELVPLSLFCWCLF